MKISYNWLQNYLNINLTPDKLSSLLTDIGLEVESVDCIDSVKGGLEGVVIGEIVNKVKHPNADRLNLTTVDIGKEGLLQIVCGAPNVEVGQKVPVATVGTWLYSGDDKFKIKRSKIRGEESSGMICAEYELGLGEDNEGIMILDQSADVGMQASEYFNLESDIIFDIGLTPNRSDAMSHIGVARDLMTALNAKGSNLKMCIPSVSNFNFTKKEPLVVVDIKDSDLCVRYSSLNIEGVKVAKSPSWLQDKLNAIGVSPINNVVDITNYVLHETGQPLHAFDAACIEGSKIVVGTVKDQTVFTTLDGDDRKLSSEDLIISDNKRPLCIAGVLGGINSGVTNTTTSIFLESAYFNPTSIRRTSKRHILSTDASFRFERGCDPNNTVYALKRAALMIVELCGGIITSDVSDIYPNKIDHFAVDLDYLNMDRLIGCKLERDIVKQILIDLGITVKKDNKTGLSLLVPPFKTDVRREIDVIEEVLRIYGFNNIEIDGSMSSSFSDISFKESDLANVWVSELLSNNGFSEAMNNSLTKSEYVDLIEELDAKNNVNILNPLSKDLNVMRQSLLFGGLENVAYNLNRQQSNVKLYEFGNTYHKKKNGNLEVPHLQIITTGSVDIENWNTSKDSVDFYYIKEKVDHVVSRLGIKEYVVSESSGWGRSYSLSYSYKGKRLVCFGKVATELCDKFGVKSAVYMADFDWSVVLDSFDNSLKYSSLNKYPTVRRDLSLLVDKDVPFSQLQELAFSVDNKILTSVGLFDVYEDSERLKDKKSYALSFVFEDKNKTLTDVYIDKIMGKMIELFNKNGAEIR